MNLLLAVEGVIRRNTDRSPDRVKHLLVLEYRLPLGCLVHMTPVFEMLKRSRPEINLTVATCGLGLKVFRHSRFIDRLIDAPDPTTDLSAAVRGLRRQLRSHAIRPDCVLTGATDQRTRIALMGMLGSTGWRGGYTLRPSLYHQPLEYDDGLSLIGNNLRLAKLVGCDAEVKEPTVFFSSADAEAAEMMLRTAKPDGRPVVTMVTQTSGGQRTGWHTERFVELIRHVALELGFAVVFVGTAADAVAIDMIRMAAGGIGTSIAGRTSVSELAAVLALSDFVVAPDTGTMHVGRAVGVPMVVLGPSWHKPLQWMPLGVKSVRLLRGEDRTDIPEGYRLDEIRTQDVIAALGELVEAYPPSARARKARELAGLSETDHLQL